MSVRAFPMPKHARPEGWAGPFCKWCGDKIMSGRRDRGIHDGRGEERNCWGEMALHTIRDVQFRHVAARDGLKCHGCGEAPERWRREEVGLWRPYIDPRDPRIEIVGDYWKVTRVSCLEVEHTVPLWSVSHLPDDERRKFFGPEYLRLMGPCCHKPKTKAEAGARAKVKRLEAKRLEIEADARTPAPAWPTRKLQSRGFAAVHRPLRSRNDLAKKKPRR